MLYQILREWPIWALPMLLCMVSILPIQLMRNYFEGTMYQVAFSAQFGDVGLAFILLIVIGVAQRGASLPVWMVGGGFEITAAVLAICVGVLWAHADWHTQYADRCHHLVVAPILVYLMLTLLPLIFTNGTKLEMGVTFMLLVLWAWLMAVDIQTGRMNQRQWLRDNMGVKFKNETQTTRCGNCNSTAKKVNHKCPVCGAE